MDDTDREYMLELTRYIERREQRILKLTDKIHDTKFKLECEFPASQSMCDDLIEAMEEDEWETFLELLDSHPELDETGRDGNSPLISAINLGRVDYVAVLALYGADLHWVSTNDCAYKSPPLHRACEVGHEPVARFLLKAGAQVEKKDVYGRTPLLVAARAGKVALVNLLLTSGAIIDARWSGSECPVYTICSEGQLSGEQLQRTLAVLLRHGASVDATGRYGATALCFALRRGENESAMMLMEYGARLTAWYSYLPRRAERDAAFCELMNDEMSSPSPLQRQCVQSIRTHLVKKYKGSIVQHVAELLLPTLLIRHILLGSYVQLESSTGCCQASDAKKNTSRSWCRSICNGNDFQ